MAWICPYCHKAAGQTHVCQEGHKFTVLSMTKELDSLRKQLEAQQAVVDAAVYITAQPLCLDVSSVTKYHNLAVAVSDYLKQLGGK